MFENKSINELFAKVQQAFETKKPFVVYRQPESDVVNGFFQKNNDVFLRFSCVKNPLFFFVQD